MAKAKGLGRGLDALLGDETAPADDQVVRPLVPRRQQHRQHQQGHVVVEVGRGAELGRDAAAREPHSQVRPDANLSIWSRFLAHRQILSLRLLKPTGF